MNIVPRDEPGSPATVSDTAVAIEMSAERGDPVEEDPREVIAQSFFGRYTPHSAEVSVPHAAPTDRVRPARPVPLLVWVAVVLASMTAGAVLTYLAARPRQPLPHGPQMQLPTSMNRPG